MEGKIFPIIIVVLLVIWGSFLVFHSPKSTPQVAVSAPISTAEASPKKVEPKPLVSPKEDTAEAALTLKMVKSKDRCWNYRQEVRRAAELYLGINYPWHYQLGCMKQESGCRDSLVSFDGGIGLFQLTPSTGITTEIQKDLKIIIDPYKAEDNTKAQAYYISKIINKYYKLEKVSFRKGTLYPKKYTEECGTALATVYQHYNGGYWFLSEASKVDEDEDKCDRDTVKEHCSRGGAIIKTNTFISRAEIIDGKTKNGVDLSKVKYLDFCDVNYNYPHQIFNYGEKYKLKEYEGWKYW